uniref:Uncharacterized protein n=1 Tax=Pinctada fucata TaxID=50426 RepID=A0A194AP32_PINFU
MSSSLHESSPLLSMTMSMPMFPKWSSKSLPNSSRKWLVNAFIAQFKRPSCINGAMTRSDSDSILFNVVVVTNSTFPSISKFFISSSFIISAFPIFLSNINNFQFFIFSTTSLSISDD